MRKINKALISVSDKSKIVEFAKELQGLGIEIISTGGTAKLLSENGIQITEVSDYTGYPEMLDGRVKTLHPKIHAGILAIRDDEGHMDQLEKQGIDLIDMVVVNLYPFEKTVAQEDVSIEEAIENIDIGGPTLVRAAAKNYRYVVVVTDPSQYDTVLAELKANDRMLSNETRFKLAKEAFSRTARYDAIISSYLESISEHRSEFPETYAPIYTKVQGLRYGENPHQQAAFYRIPYLTEPCVATARQLHGRELSFNNILDLNAALEIVKDFDEPTAAIIKHNNPCGVASHESSLAQAYRDALACDPLSAFGSIIALNRVVDLETAKAIREAALSGSFPEAIIAPGYKPDALELLAKAKERRILEVEPLGKRDLGMKEVKAVAGGILVQERDLKLIDRSQLRVVTEREPTPEEMDSLLFAWKVCKHVKSNAILLAQDKRTVGIGAGQMSRVDSTIIAIRKAGDRARGAVMASDAFIPFRDSVDLAAEAGVVAIIQPGGSKRDEEVIKAANEHGIAMVFTGVRHFKH